MKLPLTIIMYHSVRDYNKTKYPEIRGLDISAFKGQLEYFAKHYTFISPQELIFAVTEKNYELTPNSIVLTFDDGLREHYQEVFPILSDLGISGIFFPPAKPVIEEIVLEVHKIHYILASLKDKSIISSEIIRFIDNNGEGYKLENSQFYINQWMKPGRWDTPEVHFVKRMLQLGLPEKARADLINNLFIKYVTEDESALSAEIYISQDELKEMKNAEMFIGAHGYEHDLMGNLPYHLLELDINKSLEFLDSLGVSTENWIMCYPYASYNEVLIDIIKKKHCAIAMAINNELTYLGQDDPFLMSRLDTKYLPFKADEPISSWTKKMIDFNGA